jgi:hypothetical protein
MEMLGRAKKGRRMDERLIETIAKSDFQEIRIYIQRWKGRDYLHVRTWYREHPLDDFKPTKKGVSVPVKMIGDLRRAIDKALATALHSAEGE